MPVSPGSVVCPLGAGRFMVLKGRLGPEEPCPLRAEAKSSGGLAAPISHQDHALLLPADRSTEISAAHVLDRANAPSICCRHPLHHPHRQIAAA
ncbi:MAG: hypothetical protein ACOX84_03600 [Methanothrix sp.]|uniref:hypothetical protein n=1 Tax=Methanothrix sp. TaxID=90426 RepID=UPI001BD412C1